MAYKRRTKTGSDGVKRTTTVNTKTGFTQSYSSAKRGASYRQTHSLKNGKWTTTETIRDSAGFVTRRKLGVTPKTKSSYTRPKKRRSKKSDGDVSALLFIGGIFMAIYFLKSLFDG